MNEVKVIEVFMNGIINFDNLAADAEKILTTDYDGSSLDTFYKYGGLPGGARPKVFVKIDGKEWLVKFKETIDPVNIGGIEYEYSLLAKKCGINMPETKLFEGKYFGVERFDRTPQGKIHTVSAAGLLGANYRELGLDYESLLKLCHILTKNMEELYQLFRLAAEIWDIASERFAKGASGDVHVFSTGAKRYGPYGERTWWRIEKKALLLNKKVKNIFRMKKNGTKAKNGHVNLH